MMAFAWVALWIMAILMAGFSPPKSGVRWAAATAFAGGCGALSATIDDLWIPWMMANWDIGTATELAVWRWVEACCSMISLWGLPIFFLQFAWIHSSNLESNRWPMYRFLSFIPLIFMSFVDVPQPNMKFSFDVLAFWAVPYLIGGCTLLIWKQFTESNHFIRASRRTTNLLTIPPITFHLISNYLLRAFGIEAIWPWNAAMISCLFLGFLWFALKSGVFGIRLHAEQQRHDLSWRSVRAGATSIQHALNGEMYKIQHALQAFKKQLHLSLNQPEQVMAFFETFEQSVQRSQEVLRRMREQLAEIQLEKRVLDLEQWLKSKSDRYQLIATQQNVKLVLKRNEPAQIRADELHLGEVLDNLIRNAFDAIERDGEIEISWVRQHKNLLIHVRDNGCGIDPKQWRAIFQAFYSTKSGQEHSGFGLFYAYEVMQRHGGWIDVHSELGKGTTMTLALPKSCLIVENKRGGK